MEHFKIDIDGDGIALVTFDSPGRSMNVFSPAARNEFADIVEKVTNDDTIKGVVLTSGKSSFCAGADLESMFCYYKTFAIVAALLRNQKRPY